MINNSNIEELVQQKLQNFEAEVSANVWDKIDSNLNQLQPTIDPSTVTETVVNSAGTNITAWVAGITAVAVGVITVGVLFFSNSDKNIVVNNVEAVASSQELVEAVPKNEIVAEQIIPVYTEQDGRENSENRKKESPVISITEESRQTALVENTNQKEERGSEVISSNETETFSNQEEQNTEVVEEKIDNTIAPVSESQIENPVQVLATKNSIPEIIVADEIIEKVIEQESINEKPSSIGIIPNVFTPNGDGINDHFILVTENIAELKVNIYNSKGELVYQIADSDKGNWDGKLKNGQMAEVGSYYYALYATGFDKQKHQRKGSLYLNR